MFVMYSVVMLFYNYYLASLAIRVFIGSSFDCSIVLVIILSNPRVG